MKDRKKAKKTFVRITASFMAVALLLPFITTIIQLFTNN